jgi:hypothetical protein
VGNDEIQKTVGCPSLLLVDFSYSCFNVATQNYSNTAYMMKTTNDMEGGQVRIEAQDVAGVNFYPGTELMVDGEPGRGIHGRCTSSLTSIGSRKEADFDSQAQLRPIRSSKLVSYLEMADHEFHGTLHIQLGL